MPSNKKNTKGGGLFGSNEPKQQSTSWNPFSSKPQVPQTSSWNPFASKPVPEPTLAESIFEKKEEPAKAWFSGGQSEKVTYKGGFYKLHKGPLGGTFIKVQGKKVYINKK